MNSLEICILVFINLYLCCSDAMVEKFTKVNIKNEGTMKLNVEQQKFLKKNTALFVNEKLINTGFQNSPKDSSEFENWTRKPEQSEHDTWTTYSSQEFKQIENSIYGNMQKTLRRRKRHPEQGRMIYKFSYQVEDEHEDLYFTHSEHQSDKTTQGEYKVKLPDGRLQIVTYIADEHGYKSQVNYKYDKMTVKDGELSPNNNESYSRNHESSSKLKNDKMEHENKLSSEKESAFSATDSVKLETTESVNKSRLLYQTNNTKINSNHGNKEDYQQDEHRFSEGNDNIQITVCEALAKICEKSEYAQDLFDGKQKINNNNNAKAEQYNNSDSEKLDVTETLEEEQLEIGKKLKMSLEDFRIQQNYNDSLRREPNILESTQKTTYFSPEPLSDPFLTSSYLDYHPRSKTGWNNLENVHSFRNIFEESQNPHFEVTKDDRSRFYLPIDSSKTIARNKKINSNLSYSNSTVPKITSRPVEYEDSTGTIRNDRFQKTAQRNNMHEQYGRIFPKIYVAYP